MGNNNNSIKPSEVPGVLLAELKGIDLEAMYAEVGTVLQVSDGVVRIFGLRNAEASELLEFENGMKAVVMNLEEDNVGAVLLGPTDQIKEGDTVRRTGHTASINVNEQMLGRVINPLGVNVQLQVAKRKKPETAAAKQEAEPVRPEADA